MVSGVIDKLDVRVRRGSRLTTNVQDIVDRKADFLRPRRPMRYGRVVDLRGWGLNSILYLRNRLNADHKVEIIGTGAMTFSQMTTEITEIFDMDPFSVEIMRIDLAVDVPEYTVDWFRKHARVVLKRNSDEHGHYSTSHRRSETLYFGTRPNQIRIYDKIAQLRHEYRRVASRWNRSKPLPTFEQEYGYAEQGFTLTRVERQCGGGRIPAEIRTIQKVFENGVTFNPFESLQFLPILVSEDSLNKLSGRDFVMGHGVVSLIKENGYARAKQILDEKTSRNTARIMERLEKSLGSDPTNTPPDLYSIYREAVERQLAA